MISTVNRSRLISRRSPDTVIPPSGNAIFTASRKRNGVSRSIPSGFIIKLPLRQLFKSYPVYRCKTPSVSTKGQSAFTRTAISRRINSMQEGTFALITPPAKPAPGLNLAVHFRLEVAP